MDLEPKTVEEVLALPEIKDTREVLCSHCHHTLIIPLFGDFQLRAVAEDSIALCWDSDGNCYQPVFTPGRWHKKRMYL